MSARKTVLIMAGGTGGHVFPALAVADTLRARGVHVEWLGTDKGIEARLVPANALTLNAIDAIGLRGKHWRDWLRAPLHLWRAFRQAYQHMRRIRPDVVLGMGGFASGPGGVIAWLTRTPLVIHEQNAIAGTTNRLLARLSTRALQAFPGALPDAVAPRFVGNPLRRVIEQVPPPEQRYCAREGQGRLLIVGGSLGAKAINEMLPRALSAMPAHERPMIWHQTGAQHEVTVRKLYEGLGLEARVEPFIENMHDAYAWADVVLCRSGAMTVAEISSIGVASVLVPFPHAIDDHQTANARWLADQGAAFLLPQSDMSTERLLTLLSQIGQRRDEWLAMGMKARRLAVTDAAERVANECLEISLER